MNYGPVTQATRFTGSTIYAGCATFGDAWPATGPVWAQQTWLYTRALA